MKARSALKFAMIGLALIPSCVIYATHRSRDEESLEDFEFDGIQIDISDPAKSSSRTTAVRRIEHFNRGENVGPFSDAVRAGDFIFLSGEIPRDPESGEVVRGDIAAATRRVIDNVKQTLEQQGLDLADLVMVTVYLKDMGNYAGMNAAYSEYFERGQAPARATVQVSRLALDADMELAAVAYRGRSR